MKRVLILAVGVAGLAATSSAAPQGVRNPFWPAGYQGETSPISAEIRVKPKPKPPAPPPKPVVAEPKPAVVELEREQTAKAAAEEAAKRKAAEEAAAKAKAEAEAKAAAEAAAEAAKPKVVPAEQWVSARRMLKIGSPAVFRLANGVTRASISINGHIYVDGDLVSINHDGCRFTWRVGGITDAVSTLKLIRVKARFLDSAPVKASEQKGPSK